MTGKGERPLRKRLLKPRAHSGTEVGWAHGEVGGHLGLGGPALGVRGRGCGRHGVIAYALPDRNLPGVSRIRPTAAESTRVTRPVRIKSRSGEQWMSID